MDTRFLTNYQPEFSEEGFTKYQSNIEKHRNYITEHRVDISYSSRYAAMEDTFIKIANGEAGGEYKEAIFKMPKISQVLLTSFMEARNNSLLHAKTTMDENGKCTVHDPHTGRPLIAGDGAIPQINRFAGMYAYSKLSVAAFNKAIMSMSQKSANPTGNQYIFICNERCYSDVQVVLAEHLMQFKPIAASVYSQESGGKLRVGAEYDGYNFLGNEVIFKVDRALSHEYPDRGYAVLIDLTADKTSGQPALQMFTLSGSEFLTNTVAGVGGLDGTSSGAVASPVAGSKYVNSGYAGIGVFTPYRSYVLIEN